MNEARLLIDSVAGGAWNMALDEALLETAAATGQPTLRFYEWQEPTLSLGYFQSVADRRQHSASLDCPLVRRASGGGAILHDRELTYSITLPQPTAAAALYDACHETLIAALSELGVAASMVRQSASCKSDDSQTVPEPFLCFQRRTCSDIVCEEAKIVGSAQRRRRGAVLQHGSILLARSTFAPELPGIKDVAGIETAADELIARWTPRLAARLGLSFRESGLSASEHSRSEALSLGRFASTGHLERR
jgi:lipoate-protein ligase A